MTVSESVRHLSDELAGRGSGTPRLDAEVLAAHALGTDRKGLIMDGNRDITPGERHRLEEALARRSVGEPVAYITGFKEFYSLPFRVDRRVLVPRPETELLVDLALYHARQGARVLDVGTGSGAIAVAVKKNRPDCAVAASDISEGALEVARRNAEEILGAGRVEFLRGDLFSPFAGRKFDIILSNPPYIDPSLRASLPRELGFEPETALFCGGSGREIVRRIIAGGRPFLEKGGMMLIEIGADMKGDVLTFAGNGGYNATVARDYAGLPRVALLKG